MSKPRRRIKIKIEIESDDWGSALPLLDNDIYFRIAKAIDRNESSINVVSAGPSCSYTIIADEDVAVTHENYFTAIRSEIDRKKQGEL